MERGVVVRSARQALGPVLRELGYAAGRRVGPGLEWTKTADTGRFSLGLASGPWDEITGSRLTVTFGGDVLDRVYALFLEHLPSAAQAEWQAVARSVFDRALGRGTAVPDDLLETRRALLQVELSGLEAGYLDAFGWPWFDERDLTRWWDFIGRHLAAGEAAAMADARERQDEDPTAEPPDPPTVVALPEDVAEQLWRYGEDELALRMLDCDDATWEQVIVTAAVPPARIREHGGTVDDALVHAAVEVLTGTPRPLARTRRRPAGRLADFWAQVGQERDRRSRA